MRLKKGNNLMESKRTIPTRLEKVEGKDCIIFSFENEELIIDLNSDNQDSLKHLFYNMIHELFNGLFEIEKPKSSYEPKLFLDIANDYIDKLTNELEEIWKKLPSELKNDNKN